MQELAQLLPCDVRLEQDLTIRAPPIEVLIDPTTIHQQLKSPENRERERAHRSNCLLTPSGFPSDIAAIQRRCNGVARAGSVIIDG